MRRVHEMLAVALLVAATFALYRPALSFELMGDDYQWVQLAHRAMHRPGLLLADLDGFYRPASTWTLALDRLAWGFRPTGYHATNLVLHALSAVALYLVARRLGLSVSLGVAVAALWATSPFAFEPAAVVALRFEELLLLSWLALALAWPAAGERWTPPRAAIVAAATGLAMMSKETWVVTPALVWTLSWTSRDSGWRTALRAALPFAALAGAYSVAHLLLVATPRDYVRLGMTTLAKLPHELAAFLYLEQLTPAGFTLTWRGALALACVAAAVCFAAARRLPAAGFGAALCLWPSVPTLLVPYLPTRYTAIPYAGFLLLLAGCLPAVTRSGSRPTRIAATGGAAALAGAVLVAGVATVRADMRDAARISRVHATLLAQARAVAPHFPLDRPVAIVRRDRFNPLHDIAASPEGLPKLLFVRHPDPAGLADGAALFEWVIGREDVTLRRFDDGETRFRTTRGALLASSENGFAWLGGDVPGIGEVARRLRLGGTAVRLVAAEPLR